MAAPSNAELLGKRYQKASKLLSDYQDNISGGRQKVEAVIRANPAAYIYEEQIIAGFSDNFSRFFPSKDFSPEAQLEFLSKCVSQTQEVNRFREMVRSMAESEPANNAPSGYTDTQSPENQLNGSQKKKVEKKEEENKQANTSENSTSGENKQIDPTLSKISKYHDRLKTEEGRKALLEGKLEEEDIKKGLKFDQQEIDTLLAAGLIRGATDKDGTEFSTNKNFTSQDEWELALVTHIKEQAEKKDQAIQNLPSSLGSATPKSPAVPSSNNNQAAKSVTSAQQMIDPSALNKATKEAEHQVTMAANKAERRMGNLIVSAANSFNPTRLINYNPSFSPTLGGGTSISLRWTKHWAFKVLTALGVFVMLFLFSDINEKLSLLPPFEQDFRTQVVEAGGEASVSVQKSGPDSVANGELISYSISVKFVGNGLGDIEILDKLPINTEVIEISDGGINEGGTVKWRVIGLGSGQSKAVTLKVRPTETNVWKVNQAEARVLSVTGLASGAINACTFTRASQSNPVGSSKLMAIFTEVSQKSGIPASVLASVAMHENPTFTINAKDDHAAFGTEVVSGGECKHFATSSTGALGFMQVQPSQRILPIARADAHDDVGARLGAEMMGKTYESLTLADHCDVRSSVYLGAGVLLSKNGRKPPTTPQEIENAVCRYYGGTCFYGNNHNYGGEARADFERCQTQTATTSSVSQGGPTNCSGNPVNFSSAQKILLPLPNQNKCSATATKSCGRPGKCEVPRKIVLHITAGLMDAQKTYEYFATGSAGRGVGSHFIVGNNGQVLQLVEMLDNQVEIAYAVAGYSDHISIEITGPNNFNGIKDLPAAQYDATFKLVKELMQRYNIPVGSIEYNWQANNGKSNEQTNDAAPGIYGHYQLNPTDRSDPGEGFMREIREALKR